MPSIWLREIQDNRVLLRDIINHNFPGKKNLQRDARKVSSIILYWLMWVCMYLPYCFYYFPFPIRYIVNLQYTMGVIITLLLCWGNKLKTSKTTIIVNHNMYAFLKLLFAILETYIIFMIILSKKKEIVG